MTPRRCDLDGFHFRGRRYDHHERLVRSLCHFAAQYLISVARAMTRNEIKYPDPERFLPERFLLENGDLNDDTVGYTFGAGRRICVGRHVADASLWSAIVTILAVFRIMPCKDARGHDVLAEPRWTAGITSYVMPCL